MARKEQPKADRRARFAVEYAKDLNGTQAAIRAGYAPGSAHVAASRLLDQADVREHIERILAKAAEAAAITVERTQREIARIAYGDIGRLFDEDDQLKPLSELEEADRALIGGLEVEELYEGRGDERRGVGVLRKVRLRDKLVALEKCMAILGLHKTASPADSGALNLTIKLSRDSK